MKNKKRLLASLCCALMISAVPLGATSCNVLNSLFPSSESSSTGAPEVFEGGQYYNGGTGAAAEGANTLTLTEGGLISLTMDGELKEGTYTFQKNAFAITFNDETTATAELKDGAIVLRYDGESYTFLEKVEFTVSYDVEGMVLSTAKVVNGKTVSAPNDPTKAGYVFVGWYTDATFKKPFLFNVTPVTTDLTLYARFTEALADSAEFTVKFMVDGEEAFDAMETKGGVIAYLPTPEKSGMTFAGWWVGDEDGKLMSKYEGQVLKENTVLYAVWDTGAPLVQVTSRGVSWEAKGVNNSYTVTITAPNGEEESSTTTAASYPFDFENKEPGEYKVEVALNGKTTTVYYKNKFLAKVSNFMVLDSKLVFTGVENATKYLITSSCGSETHVHNDTDNGNSTVYDFSECAMKEGGITFVVKAVADGYVSSESEVFVVERTLAATALTVDKATETANWTAVEKATEYEISINGTVVKKVDAATTSFDLKGYEAGELNIKVTAKAHGYNASSAQTVYNKTSLLTPSNVRLVASTLTWNPVEGATGYKVKIGNKEYTAKTNEFVLQSEYLDANATSCAIQIKAVGATSAQDSIYGEIVQVQLGTMSDSLTYANGTVTWEPVINVKRYEVQLNGGEIVSVDATKNSYKLAFTNAGSHVIKVRCVKADDTASAWVETYVKTYKMSFEVGGGATVETLYLAEGDEVKLPETTKVGYDLVGWFNTPNGTNGTEYDKEIVQGAEDMTIYAHWTGKKIKVNLQTSEGTLEVDQVEVTFDQPFTLPVLQSEGSDFGGWFTEINGKGTRYTNNEGVGVGVWKDVQEITLIADWIHILAFVEVTDEENGGTGYEVVGGADVKSVATVRIPETYKGKAVISIGASAFENCSSLKRIEMPDTIQSIARGDGKSKTGHAFKSCSNLTEFVVYETEGGHDRHYQTIDGVLVHNNPNTGKELVYISEKLTGTFVIPEGVEVIPDFAFGNTDFEKVVIPQSVKEISAYAFYNAYYMTAVEFVNAEIPLDENNGLVLSEYAFDNCHKLVEITLPARTLQLAAEAPAAPVPEEGVTFALVFSSCYNLQKINVATPTVEGATFYSSRDGFICDKTGANLIYASVYRTGAVEIPVSVSTIKANAFYGCEKITSLKIHAFVTSIEASAFENCKAITSIEFGGRATDAPINIASRAFYSCSSVTKLTLPANLGTLAQYAFGKTTALTEVVADVGADAKIADGAFGTVASGTSASSFYVTKLHIGANVPVINVAGVFGGEKLLYLTVDSANPNFSVDENGVLYNKVIDPETGKSYPTEILYYPVGLSANEYVMPETITAIGADVFKGKSFKNVTISSKVVSIGASAFANCPYLETVTFADADLALTEENALTIGANAFQNCARLQTVVLPKRLTSIGNAAFSGCKAFTGELVIPENVASVGASVFNGCAGITKVTVQGAATEFVLASETIKIQNKNTTINFFGTFAGCSSLTEIVINEAHETYVTVNGVIYKKDGGVITELVYCPMANVGVEKEDNGVMKKVVEVPKTVTTVWSYAFKDATKIDKVVFVADETNPVDLTVNARAFFMTSVTASNLNEIILPKGMTIVGMKSFEQSSVTNITIPNTVKDVQIDAFSNATRLETVNFEEGGTEALIIGLTKSVSSCYGPFYKCTALKNINLPERTSYIGYYAFSYCSSLESIHIPASVETLWNMSFQFCDNLEEVTFAEGSKLTSVKGGVFSSAGLKRIQLPDTVTEIASNSFGSTLLESFVVPAGVKTLAQAFSGSSSPNYTLKSVTFAEGSQLTEIGNNAFSYCHALEEISIPSTVTKMGFWVFRYCYNLSKVTFETNEDGKISMKTMDKGIFDSTAVEEIVIPETTSATLTLGIDFFKNCTTIKKVSLPSQVSSLTSTFVGCATITELSIPESNPYFVVKDNILYNKDQSVIFYVLKDIAVEKLVIPEGITDIGPSAFANQPSLKEVVLPSSISSIGASAFANCKNLVKVTFNKSEDYAEKLTTINGNLFQGCSSLTTIEGLPSTLTTINTYAFEGCTSLTSFVIPNTVKTLGTFAFAYSGLKSVTISNAVTTLPNSTFEGCTELSEVIFAENSKLATINASAFESCKALKKLVLPNSVKTINSWGFAESGLEEITLSENLTTLGSYAFQNVTGLTSITIPEGVTALESYLFDGCTSLTTVNLPTSIKTIKNRVFSYCTSLKEITIPEAVTELSNGSSWSTSRDSSAFLGCTALTTVNLNNVTKLGANAFSGCTALVNIDLSKVTNTNSSVFLDCTSLKAVDLSALATPYGSEFKGCTNLESVTFGASLSKIPANMFEGCTKLSNVVIPDAVSTIGSSAFKDCVSLTSIVLPSKVVALSASLFEGCINLENVEIKGKVNNIGNFVFKGCAKITEFKIPASVTTTALGNRIFEGTSITTITIPKGYTKDWSNTNAPFAGCDTLTEILVSDGNSRFESRDGVLYDSDGVVRAVPNGKVFENDTFVVPEGADVGKMAFAGCYNIKKVILPDSMTIVGDNAFRESGVETVVLGANVTVINSWVFRDATNLKSVAKADGTLNGITEIKSQAFYGTTALESIVFPASLTTVGSSAFQFSGLKSVTIPATLTSLAATTFSDCANLTEVIIEEGVTSLANSLFANTGVKNVVIPSTVTTIGNSVFNGSALESIVIPSTVTSLGTSVFQNCKALKSVTIGEGITALGANVFDGCTALTEVNLPSTLTSIGNYAFQATGLKSIVLPAAVTSMGSSAFNGSALESITLNEGLTAIGASAFLGCTSLKEVVLPSTVTSLGTSAFSGCTALTKVVLTPAVTSIGATAFANCTSLTTITIPSMAILSDNVFSGWTATQTVRLADSAYFVASTSSAKWNGGNATVVYNYVEA